jgi:hypothetical protein
VQPDLVTVVALVIWAAATTVALLVAWTPPARGQARKAEWASL